MVWLGGDGVAAEWLMRFGSQWLVKNFTFI